MVQKHETNLWFAETYNSNIFSDGSVALTVSVCCFWAKPKNCGTQTPKKISKKMLKCTLEMSETAELGDDSLWVCHYERHLLPFSHFEVKKVDLSL